MSNEGSAIRWIHNSVSATYHGFLGGHLIGSVERYQGRKWRIAWTSVRRPDQSCKSLADGKAIVERCMAELEMDR